MDLSVLRSRARQALSGHWGSAVLVTLLAGLLGGIGTSGFSGSSGTFDSETWQTLLNQYPAVERA